MPTAIAGAALSAGFGAATGATLFGLTVAQTALVSFAANIAMSFVTGALSSTAKRSAEGSTLNRETQDNTLTVRQAAAARQMIFGQGRSGGTYTLLHTTGTNNNNLPAVVTCTGHSVRGFDALYLDDEIVPLDSNGNATGKYAGKIKCIYGLGTTSGDVDFHAALTAAVGSSVWGPDDKQEGCAKAYIEFIFDNNLFGGALPNPSFVISGNDAVDDPRASAGWTDNAALCIAQYMTDTTRGLGYLSDNIDQTALIAAANDCDEMVARVAVGVDFTADSSTDIITLSSTDGKLRTGTRVTASNSGGSLPGGLFVSTNYFWISLDPTSGKLAATLEDSRAQTSIDLTSDGTGTNTVNVNAEPRYTLNGRVDTSNDPDLIVPRLLSAMAGIKVESGGKVILLAGVWRAVTTATIDEQILDGGVSSSHRRGRGVLFNGAKGTFVNPDDAWVPTDFPSIKPSQYLTEDGGVRSWRDAELRYTSSPSMAQRILRIDLEKTRRQQTCTLPITLAGLTYRAGDNIAISNDKRGWTDKTFFLSNWTLEPRDVGGENPRIGVTIIGDEIDATVYSWTPATDEVEMTPSPLTNLPSSVPVAPTSIIISENPYSLEGSVTVAWTASVSGFALSYQVEFMLVGASKWSEQPGRTEATNKIVAPILPGDYFFRVKAVSTSSQDSDYLTSNVFTVNVPAIMPRVSGLELRGNLANENEFTGKDAKFIWREASQTQSYELGEEPQGGDDGTRDTFFQDFEIRILDSSENILRVEHTLDPFFDYTFEKNGEDNIVGGLPSPERGFTIEVYQRGQQNQISALPARMTVSNPAPGQLVSLSIRASSKFIFVEYVPDADLDFDGVQVFVDTSSGFTPGPGTLAATTISRIIGIDAEAYTTYYVVVAAFDAFGTDGIVFSPEIEITTQQVGTTDIQDNAISTPLLIAGAVTADKMTVGALSAITANIGTATAGVVQNAAGNFIIDLDNGTFVSAGPNGQLADDYMSMTNSSLEFYHWTGSTHTLSKAVNGRANGVASNGDIVTIPGFFAVEPTVLLSPNSLQVYDQASAAQSQSLLLNADNLREDPGGSGTWKFDARAELTLSESQGTTILNSSSGSISANTYTEPPSGTITTETNTTDLTLYVRLTSVRGTGTSPNYNNRTVDWRLGRRLTGTNPKTVTLDNTTEELSATAHGFADLAGPYAIGSTVSLPPELSETADYWIILIDANTFQLASSAANAASDTAVAFSDDGSGTITMGAFNYSTYQTKSIGDTLTSVTDQRTFAAIEAAEYDIEIDYVSSDEGGTFSVGGIIYDYDTASRFSADDLNHTYVGNFSPTIRSTTLTPSMTSYTPPAGWAVYSVDYAYDYSWYSNTGLSGFNNVATTTGPGGVSEGFTTGGFSSGDTSLATLTGAAFTTASYSATAINITVSQRSWGSGGGVTSKGRIKSADALIYIRKPQTNSTTPANTFEFLKYDWELSAASQLAEGSVNWIAFGNSV